jgi:hypothetical protein
MTVEEKPSPSPVVAVLCAQKHSVYKTHPECDVFDVDRNAFTFAGRMPVIAHPPCRSWGVLSHFVKGNVEAEKALAGWCLAQVQRNGGVLEHPAHSRLFTACNLPRPGHDVDVHGGFTLGVEQWWWGHLGQKATWLYIVGIRPANVSEIPFRMKTSGCKDIGFCSSHQRSATPVAFAAWLIALASKCNRAVA